MAPREGGPAEAGFAEGVASSFGIASLPLEESSSDSTLSHVYGRGLEDTQVVPPTLGRDDISLFPLALDFYLFRVYLSLIHLGAS